MAYSTNSNFYPERALEDLNRSLGTHRDAEVMAIVGDLFDGVDDAIMSVLEASRTKDLRDKLCVVLRTQGGYIEVVERIVGTLRHNFETVEFVVPNCAYSAGTALALSGDAIHMNYYSRLGPIDPQVRSQRGRSVPAIGYLARYEEILAKADAGHATPADIAMLLDFDQAELYSYDQARRLAVRLVAHWLATHKFKDWTWSKSRNSAVSDEMRRERAEEIATQLSDPNRWNSHGYGISKDSLIELGLKIDDFDADPSFRQSIMEYDGLLHDYLQKLGLVGALHFGEILVPLLHRP